MSQIKTHCKLAELNSKLRNLESNGFKEYLNTWETVNGDDYVNHIVREMVIAASLHKKQFNDGFIWALQNG